MRHRDHIQLRKWILDAEVAVVQRKEFLRSRECCVPLLSPARGRPPSNIYFPPLSTDRLQLTGNQHEQIGRHSWSCGESDSLEWNTTRIRTGGRLHGNGRIGDNRIIRRQRCGESECRLGRRLVPAWKHATGAVELELSYQHVVLALPSIVLYGEQTRSPSPNGTRVRECKGVSSRAQQVRKMQ